MAQTAGFTCDACGGFAVAIKNDSSLTLPPGWITVHPRTPQGARGGLDICSNACLALLGKMRWEAEPENEGRKFTFNFVSGRSSGGRSEESKLKDRERAQAWRAARKAEADG